MSMIQPFGVKLYRGIWKAHRPFFAKTVMVKDGDVDHAMRLLNKFDEFFFDEIFSSSVRLECCLKKESLILFGGRNILRSHGSSETEFRTKNAKQFMTKICLERSNFLCEKTAPIRFLGNIRLFLEFILQ